MAIWEPKERKCGSRSRALRSARSAASEFHLFIKFFKVQAGSEDGSKALGFFDRVRQTETATYNKLGRIGLPGKYLVRDLWRQKDLEDAAGSLKLTVPGHGVVLLELTRAS